MYIFESYNSALSDAAAQRLWHPARASRGALLVGQRAARFSLPHALRLLLREALAPRHFRSNILTKRARKITYDVAKSGRASVRGLWGRSRWNRWRDGAEVRARDRRRG